MYILKTIIINVLFIYKEKNSNNDYREVAFV